MATSRGSGRPLSSPAPPPYSENATSEHNRGEQTPRGPHLTTTLPVGASGHSSDQTIPKSAEASGMASEREAVHKSSSTSKSTQHLNELNTEHTCGMSGARNGQHNRHPLSASLAQSNKSSLGAPASHHDQFIRSLAAPKSILGHISIEPLAFLAILALYIEFPAIQDLIYTKICLEVIGTQRSSLTSTQFIASNLSQALLEFNINHHHHHHHGDMGDSNFNMAANQSSMSSNGRIQQSVSPSIASASVANNTHEPHNYGISHVDEQRNNRELHLLCNRLNRTAVPRELRQEILDIDSVFWLKYQILVCLLCALASPYWGGLSDKIGRLIPLNVPIVASILGNIISLIFGLLISMDSHSMFHINWLYSGAVLVGLSGGQAVLLMNAFSFLSDNTTSEERSKRVTTLESVIFVAHSVGFFISKLIMLLGLASPDKLWLNRHFVAFASCIGLNLIALLYSTIKLRHHKFHKFLNNYERERREAAAAIMGQDNCSFGSTLARAGPVECNGGGERGLAGLCGERLRELTLSTPDDPDGPIARTDKRNWNFWDTMVTFRYYKETFVMATKQRDTRSTILLLLLAGFVSSLSLATLMSLLFVYVKMEPFNWTSSQYSSWNSISSITRGVALISLTILMKFAPSFWSVPDPIIAAIGFLGKGVGLLMIGLAHSTSALNWSLMAFTFSEYSMPPIRSYLSKLVVSDELGKVYSCIGSLQSLCFILGNIVFYVAFTSFTLQNFFRISFLVVGGVELSAVVIMLIIYSSSR